MIILLNDAMQESDAPDEIKSPALSETAVFTSPMVFTFPEAVPVSAIGIGNTDGTFFSIDLELDEPISTHKMESITTHAGAEISAGGSYKNFISINYSGSGLYGTGRKVYATKITVTSDAGFIGRLGVGIGVRIPTAVAKQPGWNSTNEPRTTLSGQIVPGLGGYNYRTLSLDSRYKIDREAVAELSGGYRHTGQGYPFFIDLSDEAYKLPFSKLYATEQNQRSWSVEGGIHRFLYSYRFNFKEAF